MVDIVLVVLSIVLQLLATVLSLRLIRLTRGRLAWLLIAAAFVSIIVRRCVELTAILQGHQAPARSEQLYTNLTSLLLIAGLAAIGPLFSTAMRAEELQQEIVSRKKAEEELRESEERYHRLFANEMDAILLFDAQTLQIIDVNEAAIRLYGYDHSEFLQLKALDVSDEREATERTIAETLTHGSSRVLFRRHRRKDGTIFPVEMASSCFMLGGRLVICGVAHDISQRIQAQESLKLAHRKLISAREEERRRLSRELHDSIGQQLVAAGLKLRAMEVELRRTAGTAAPRLEELLRQHRELSEDVRRVSRALYPQVLEEFGLAAALRQLRDDMASTATVICIESDESLEDLRFDREAEIALYRIAQEALTNALRHARCNQVQIELRRRDAQVYLAVADNGRGFDVRSSSQGQGLASMRERAEAIDAAFEVASRPGDTRVSVQAPLRPLPTKAEA